MRFRRPRAEPALPKPEVLAAAIVAEIEKAPRFTGATVTDVSALVNAGALQSRGDQSAALERDTGAFARLPFSPGQPLIPGPIGPPRPDGRPEIRRWEYPVGWNLNYNASHAPWGLLRDASEQIDLVRRCIEIRKSEMIGLAWDITIRDTALETAERDAQKAAFGDQPAIDDHTKQLKAKLQAKQDMIDRHQPEIVRAREFWQNPDRIGHLPFADWLGALLEEYFVIDAVTVYPHPDNGGQLHSLELVDGTTIKPLLDVRGGVPQPPAPAFQQILYGFPRGEWQASPEDDGDFTADQLIYRPRHRRVFTPYGLSPTEQALTSADLWLKRQEWIRSEYNDSSIPAMMIKVPESVKWTPEQLRRYEEVTNEELAGQTARRVQMRLLPPGLEPLPINRMTDMYKPEYDTFLVRLMSSHFDVMPSELGFVPTKGLGGAGHQEGEEASEYRKGIKPLAAWLSDMFTDILHRYMGIDRDLEFKFTGLEADDAQRQAEINKSDVMNGIRTIDEIRADKGMPLFGFKGTNTPMIVSNGVQLLDEESMAPAPVVPPLPPSNGAGAPPPPGPPGAGRAVPAPAGGGAVPPQVRKELQTFGRFVENRQDRPWRDFEFEYVDPPAAAELNKAGKSGDWAKAIAVVVDKSSKEDKIKTIAHHVDTLAFNYVHSRKHMDEAFDITQRLLEHISSNPDLSAIADEIKAVQDARPSLDKVGTRALGKAAARGRAKTTLAWKYNEQMTRSYGPRIARAFLGLWLPKVRAVMKSKAKAADPHAAFEIRSLLGLPEVTPEIAAVFEQMYRDAWMSGVTSAYNLLGSQETYWSDWVPGNWQAAVKVLGYDLDGSGLQDMLGRAGITIKSIASNQQDRLAELIADALATGMDTGSLEDIIGLELGGNADLIARTETARAQTAATLDTYDANGVTQKQFLTAEDDRVDDDCYENEDAGPVGMDEDFPNGDPPVHPNCRCTVFPVMGGESGGETGDAEISAEGTGEG